MRREGGRPPCFAKAAHPAYLASMLAIYVDCVPECMGY